MRLWYLELKQPPPCEGSVKAMLVRARNEDEARHFAKHLGYGMEGATWSEGVETLLDTWASPETSACEEITADGPLGILMTLGTPLHHTQVPKAKPPTMVLQAGIAEIKMSGTSVTP